MKILKFLGTIGIVFSFIFGVWFVDDRFISATELTAEKDKVCVQIAMEKKAIYLQMDINAHRMLMKQYYDFKRIIRENPNDLEAKKTLNDIKLEMDDLQIKIDAQLNR